MNKLEIINQHIMKYLLRRINYEKILLCLLTAFCLLSMNNIYAIESKVIYKEIIYLDNGIYEETIIEESTISTYSTNTKSGTKTKTCKDSNGIILYTLKVSGTYTYTGSSSTCTSASATATTNSSDWTVVSKSASKSGNTATAKGIYNQHYYDKIIQTKSESITLTCSATGVLS